jgi:hypothetical protein
MNLIPVVYVALDGHKGYCIPISTDQEAREFADDVVWSDFDHLADEDEVSYKFDLLASSVTRKSLSDFLNQWAAIIHQNKQMFDKDCCIEQYTLVVTDSDGRELSFIPGLRDKAEVEALEEFMGW